MILLREARTRAGALRIWREMKDLECLGKFLLYCLLFVSFRVRLHLILELGLRFLIKDAFQSRSQDEIVRLFEVIFIH